MRTSPAALDRSVEPGTRAAAGCFMAVMFGASIVSLPARSWLWPIGHCVRNCKVGRPKSQNINFFRNAIGTRSQ